MTAMASQITSLTVVYSTVYSDADQRKHQSSASLAFVWGSHGDRWIPRTKGQLRGKCFHFMTSSWIGKVHKNGSVFNFVTCPIWICMQKCPFDTYYLSVYLTLSQYYFRCNFYYIWLHICVWISECMGIICQPVGFDAEEIAQIIWFNCNIMAGLEWFRGTMYIPYLLRYHWDLWGFSFVCSQVCMFLWRMSWSVYIMFHCPGSIITSYDFATMLILLHIWLNLLHGELGSWYFSSWKKMICYFIYLLLTSRYIETPIILSISLTPRLAVISVFPKCDNYWATF